MRLKNQLQTAGAFYPEKQPPHEETQKHPRLLPLTAKYDEPSHKLYVDALNEALGDDRIHNIALSGHYGVGKSSILDKVAQGN